MPKKIRQLKAILQKAGFVYRPAKGSHAPQGGEVKSQKSKVKIKPHK